MKSFTITTNNPIVRQQFRNTLINVITDGRYNDDRNLTFIDNDKFNFEPTNIYCKDVKSCLNDLMD